MGLGLKVNVARIISYCYSSGINYDGLTDSFLGMERNNSRNIWDIKSIGSLVPVMDSWDYT